MREIKFRGKRVDNGEWMYGYYFKGFTGIPYILVLHDHILGMTEYYEVDPDTVGQYTERKDKNNTKIYEGDIVENGGMRLFVRYCSEIAGFAADSRSSPLCLLKKDCTEKIGNIHDNPELIKAV